MDLALNNLQRLICHKTKQNQTNRNNKYHSIKKNMEHEGDGDTICNLCTLNNPQRVGNKRTSGDNPDYSIIKIDPNTESSPGDLRKLAVTQTPIKINPSANTVMKNFQRSKMMIVKKKRI